MIIYPSLNKKTLSISLVISSMIFMLISCQSTGSKTEGKVQITEGNYNSSVPNICVANDGGLLVTEVREYEGGVSELWLTRKGRESLIAKGTDWIVNWADFPTILSFGESGENLVASYLVESDPEKFAYDVRLVLSNDGGESWSDPIAPHADGTITEHGFVSLVEVREDAFMVVWLDGRNYAELEGDLVSDDIKDQMQLRAALINSSGVIEEEFVIDPNVCSCCGTDLAATPGGISVVYRDRHVGEVRDISLSRYEFSTGQWTEPQTVHNDGWVIAGCPVNGPAIDSREERVVVCWYTEIDGTPAVLASHSMDGGITFSDPMKINSEYTQGRIDVILLDDNSATLSWIEGEIGSVNLQVRTYKFGDHDDVSIILSPAITVTPMNGSRASGFPKMMKQSTEHGDEIVFVYTHLSIDEATQKLTPEVREKRLDLNEGVVSTN